VLATELITFALWIFILVRTILADNTQEMILESGLFIITVVFGIFLIKSVIREVNQREKIEKLAVDLKKANTRLLELDKQKSEFVSFASHQLRAPLTAMKGYASLLIEGEFGEIKDEVKGAIKTILDSSKTLTNIVDDYLNVSRIELGTMKYSFEIIDYKKMVQTVVDELKPSIQKSKLTFNLKFNPDNENEKFIINADRDKLKQVITNLIDNSIKYTPSGSIDVSVVKNIKEKKIIFSVKDTGVGISTDAMPRLFSKFVRLDSGNKQNIYGTGLGLFVAKDIVTAHQGRIWAESDGDGKGSVFNVELDMAA
jgi:signal transduction histidine kinase